MNLHTKTRLIKHGNLGESGFQMGFQRVLNSRKRVSKGFQIPETGFVKGLQTVCKEFPKGFQRVCKEFQRVSIGYPKGFKFPKAGF